MKIAIVVITLSFMLVSFMIVTIMRALKRTYNRANEKFSDRELLQLFVEQGNILSPKQISKLSPLSSTEAMIRLQTWSNNGAMRTLYSDAGETLYQLKHKMPSQKHIFDIRQYSDAKIMEITLNHITGVELSPAHFTWLFGLNIQDARKVLKRLVAAGMVKTHFDGNFQRSYISSVNPNELGNKITLPKNAENDGRIAIKDADLLKLAINNEGRLTPTLVCVEKQVSLDEAQELIDKLYEKGAFNIEVDENDGTIEYILRDTKLYKK
jgi:predicted transcriptional regulator